MTAADHLDALAAALARAGWASRARYEPACPILQVFPPLRPAVGESVRVRRDADGWCFIDSYGLSLGPCSEVAGAAEALGRRLAMMAGL